MKPDMKIIVKTFSHGSEMESVSIDDIAKEGVRATIHSTIFDIPMRPVRDDPKHR